jgi:hypothetical protein
MLTMLQLSALPMLRIRTELEDLRSPNAGIPAPEQDGQENHVKGMRPKVRSVGEICIQGRSTERIL